MILGRDWLHQNGVRIYFDLGSIRVGKVYVPLENDIHIASIIRLAKKSLLKPQSVNVCIAKIKNNSSLLDSELLQVSAVDSGYINSEPGLVVSNSVTKIHRCNKIPVLILNSTNKTINLKRGCVVGRIRKSNVNDISSVTTDGSNEKLIDLLDQKIAAPDEHLDIIKSLISNNQDIFVEKDTDLYQTDIVKIHIDSGDHRPIKMKPFNLPIPVNLNSSDDRSFSMLAYSNLEAKAIGVNVQKTQYILLNDEGPDKCIRPSVNFGDIKSPIYRIYLSKLCIIALFMKDNALIKENGRIQ